MWHEVATGLSFRIAAFKRIAPDGLSFDRLARH